MKTKSTTHLGEERKADIGTMGPWDHGTMGPAEKRKAETLKTERGTTGQQDNGTAGPLQSPRAEARGQKSETSMEPGATSRSAEVRMQNAECRSQAVPPFTNEQQFLDGLKSFMQAGRESRAPGVALIAREWERKLTFCILITQQERQRRGRARAQREALRVQVSVAPTACPSSSRSQAGASPRRD